MTPIENFHSLTNEEWEKISADNPTRGRKGSGKSKKSLTLQEMLVKEAMAGNATEITFGDSHEAGREGSSMRTKGKGYY